MVQRRLRRGDESQRTALTGHGRSMLFVRGRPHQIEAWVAFHEGAQFTARVPARTEDADGKRVGGGPHIYAIIMHIYAPAKPPSFHIVGGERPNRRRISVITGHQTVPTPPVWRDVRTGRSSPR